MIDATKLKVLSQQLLSPDPTVGVDLELRAHALKRLIDLCAAEPDINAVMNKFELRASDLMETVCTLESAGAGQWVGGHYPPASTIANPQALAFFAERRGKVDHRLTAVLLIEYFERNEQGPVPDELRGPADAQDPLADLWRKTRGLSR